MNVYSRDAEQQNVRPVAGSPGSYNFRRQDMTNVRGELWGTVESWKMPCWYLR